MTGLLVDLPQPGYPAEYLLARLAARRECWPEKWQGLAGWGALAAEFRWLYGQLNRQLRHQLAPLFVYGELRPLFLFLRGLAAGDPAKGRELLAATLLAEPLKDRLHHAADLAGAARQLDQCWPGEVALSRHCAAGGVAALEAAATRRVLDAALRPAVLRPFWAAVVDLENVLALAKRLRWQARRPFGYLHGGALGVRCLAQAEQAQAPAMVAAYAQPLGAAMQAGEWRLEELLRQRVERQLTRQAWPMAPAVAVAAYMWAAHGVARQQAMALEGGCGT
ncbi:MAG TPA: hypothetical protein VLL73_02495 [Desulfurivibrionaceae bacterium]|nr:hypothetical protein [Desulfurivibrionaceae bacterium]